MDCNDFILSEDTIELVRALDEGIFFGKSPVCSQNVGWGYRVEYYRADEVPPLSLKDYSYAAIPKCYVQLDSKCCVQLDSRYCARLDSKCCPQLDNRCYTQIEKMAQADKNGGPFSETDSFLAACQSQNVMNLASLEQSGITTLQNLRTLDLRGRGVLVAVIDSGIRYQDEAFRDANGRTRIAAMWDQTAGSDDDATEAGKKPGGAVVTEAEDTTGGENPAEVGDTAGADSAADGEGIVGGTPPEGFLYGREYSSSEINRALAEYDRETGDVEGRLDVGREPVAELTVAREVVLESDVGRELVPESDADGHGTALASIMAGSTDAVTGFTGAAPEAELLVVKLRQAKPYLREFFYVPEHSTAYSEADILAALSYVNRKALELGRPLVICLGIGSGSGGRTGTGVLDDCLNQLAALRNRVVVCATGNAANERRHFLGATDSLLSPVRVEMNVENDANGLTAELWAVAPERFSVDVASPTGQLLSRVISIGGADQETDFLFEGTHLSVSYRDVYRFGQNLLIFFRFTNLVKGLWTIRVYPDVSINGNFHMWLPMESLSSASVTFLTPNPETTLVTPSDAYVPISVGGYDAQSGALYLASGRGYNANGGVRPDFVAPSVRLTARGLRDNYVTVTGTSGAAALTAGACAQLLEWAVTRGNLPDVNSVDMKNLLIRGCVRQENYVYPSPESGYGKLDAYQALENLRVMV